MPFEKGHCLHVCELVLNGRPHDVGVAHSHSRRVRGDLHRAARLHEGPQSSEEQTHEVLVSPIDYGMAVEEALDGAGVREVVVDGAQRVLHALEARVDRDAGAVHPVVDLRVVFLQGLDALVDLLVALPQRLYLLESRGDDAAYVTECLSVRRKVQAEGEVGVAKDSTVCQGVDELETIEAPQGAGSWVLWNSIDSGALLWLMLGSVGYEVIQWYCTVKLGHHVTKVFVSEASQLLLRLHIQLVTILECRDHI
mmetsp:Transcript_80002/g.235304  ORF Transcript_80002/g.235304 Transcript_80002/m.235304 type:complete len:253 (-) Transcript_80002:636-1394(-)